MRPQNPCPGERGGPFGLPPHGWLRVGCCNSRLFCVDCLRQGMRCLQILGFVCGAKNLRTCSSILNAEVMVFCSLENAWRFALQLHTGSRLGLDLGPVLGTILVPETGARLGPLLGHTWGLFGHQARASSGAGLVLVYGTTSQAGANFRSLSCPLTALGCELILGQ